MKKLLRRILIISLIIVVTVQPPTVDAAGNRYFIRVDRKENCVTVYEKDENGEYTVPVKAFVCSVGADNTTPKGTFRSGDRYLWRELDGGVYGRYAIRITRHFLFHSVYYRTMEPDTMYHDAYNDLGTAASHGCVRLSVADARWLYENCGRGTMVEIFDGEEPGPLGKPNALKISDDDPNRGWDPTDTDPENPWKLPIPKIIGAHDRTIEKNSGCDESRLLAGVKAVDYAGNPLSVRVSGSYNPEQPGKYRITYLAVDTMGRIAKKQVVISVQE